MIIYGLVIIAVLFISLLMMQSILFATVSGIPSPGSVGITEGAFTEIFRNVYPSEVMSTAVLLSRGINFYLFVIISGIATIINHARSSKKVYEKGWYILDVYVNLWYNFI